MLFVVIRVINMLLSPAVYLHLTRSSQTQMTQHLSVMYRSTLNLRVCVCVCVCVCACRLTHLHVFRGEALERGQGVVQVPLLRRPLLLQLLLRRSFVLQRSRQLLQLPVGKENKFIYFYFY